MLYAIICRDRTNMLERRQQTRPAHLEYLTHHPVRFAGPLLGEDESTPIGSILFVDCADRSAAEAFAAEDPYRLAGLFDQVEIQACRQVIPGMES